MEKINLNEFKGLFDVNCRKILLQLKHKFGELFLPVNQRDFTLDEEGIYIAFDDVEMMYKVTEDTEMYKFEDDLGGTVIHIPGEGLELYISII